MINRLFLMTEPPVQLFFGESLVPVNKPQSTVFKDYIIHQNQELHTENKRLLEEIHDLTTKIDFLEETELNHEKETRRLKQYVSNFHSLSEIYKELAEADNKFFKGTLKKASPSTSYMSSSNIFLAIHVVSLFAYMVVPPIVIIAGLTLMYFNFISPRVCDNLETIHNQLASYRSNIHSLLDLRRQRAQDLTGLSKTMDIIGEFIDNAL